VFWTPAERECLSLHLCCSEDPTVIVTNTSTMLLPRLKRMALWFDDLVSGRGLKLSVLDCYEAKRSKRSRDPWWEGSSGVMNSAGRETGKRATESWKRSRGKREEGGAEGE
jgi:hypothetical protein